jgi:hypothetical protein
VQLSAAGGGSITWTSSTGADTGHLRMVFKLNQDPVMRHEAGEQPRGCHMAGRTGTGMASPAAGGCRVGKGSQMVASWTCRASSSCPVGEGSQVHSIHSYGCSQVPTTGTPTAGWDLGSPLTTHSLPTHYPLTTHTLPTHYPLTPSYHPYQNHQQHAAQPAHPTPQHHWLRHWALG